MKSAEADREVNGGTKALSWRTLLENFLGNSLGEPSWRTDLEKSPRTHLENSLKEII